MEKMDTMDFDSPPVLLKKSQQPQQRPTKRKLPKITCNYLTSVATKLENNHRLQGLRKVDKYGESSESPSNRPTTICGGFLSIIFALIVLGLIIWNIFMLASQQRSITVGDRIHMNHVPDTFKIAGIIDVDGQSVHFPVLDMVIENKIFFYEADSPSIQKVRISDNTGYNPAYSTSYSVDSPPTTRSVYSKFALPFDSVDDTTGKVPGRFKAFQVNSTELLIAQLPAQFDRNAQTIQLLESARNMIAGTYYPHSTSLYIRLLRRQIDEILDNQLDVSMINVAELESLQGPYLTRIGQSKTHVSSASAFSNITTLKAPFNSLILRSNLAQSITGGGEDLNWNLKIQYSSNFNYTLTSFYCYDNSTGLLNNSTFTPLAFISPPLSSDSTFTILDQSVAAFMSSMNLDFPFEMLIWDRFQVEKVTVTGGDNSVFQVLRSGSLDFSTSTDSSNCFFKQPHPFLSYLNAPEAWTCPRQYYNDKVCDCNCGAVDVDCAFCPQSPPSYCSISPPTPTTQEVGPAVAVSIACAGTQSVRVPANGIIRGFSGSETSAKQCPEDTFYYNGSAIALPNGTLACNAKPAAQIVFDMTESTIYQALNPLVYDLIFPASLTIGISNFDVKASIQRKDKTLVVQINSGMPQTTQCGVRPNIPSSSTGYLRTPFKYDEKTFLYSPPDPSTYLPPGSPYNINILGEQLTVASAACPRGEDNMQVVTLISAPSPSLVDRLNLLTIYGYAASASLAGASQISVEPADGDSRSLSEYFCCFKELQISVGNDNTNSYVYEVTSVRSNTTDLDCCTNSCFDDIISLSLSSPLIAIVPQGIRVAAIRSFESPFPVNISASACSPESKNQTQVPVVMLSLLEAQAVSEESANIYYPNYRFLNFPVQDLDLELGMFIVPQKSGFDILSKLCPGREDVSSGNSVWVIQSDRNITVNNCSLGVPDTNDVALCGLANCTSPIILPTRQFTFSHKVPINQKWVQIPEQEIDQLNSPEYLIDVSTVYYFDYTGQDLAVGKKFSGNIPQDGDYDQFYNKFKFSGEMDFIGKLRSDDAEISLYPANAPILDFTVNITADKNLTKNMIHKIGKKLGVNKAIGWSDKTVNKFNSWNISWPLTLPLTLQPGYNYTFKATVIMQPVFNVGILGGYTLVRWINSTSTTFDISTAEFSNSNRANVRIIVSFDPSATALLNQTDFTVFDFIAAVGSALALFQIGMSILTVWQKATLHTEEPSRPNPYAPKKIRRDIQLTTLGSSL